MVWIIEGQHKHMTYEFVLDVITLLILTAGIQEHHEQVTMTTPYQESQNQS